MPAIPGAALFPGMPIGQGVMPGVSLGAQIPGGQGPVVVSWSGAAQARTGESIQISLMMSSAQPLQSAPVQIVYDPQVLRVEEVREGSFFRQGGESNFSSRIDPGGSIFIGASRAGGGSVSGSGDIATLTVTPLRAVPRTEIRLGSSTVTGANGQAAAVTAPQPFGIAITP